MRWSTQRTLSAAIDAIVLIALQLVLVVVTLSFWLGKPMPAFVGALVLFGPPCSFIALETMSGRSVGKAIFGHAVRSAAGSEGLLVRRLGRTCVKYSFAACWAVAAVLNPSTDSPVTIAIVLAPYLAGALTAWSFLTVLEPGGQTTYDRWFSLRVSGIPQSRGSEVDLVVDSTR